MTDEIPLGRTVRPSLHGGCHGRVHEYVPDDTLLMVAPGALTMSDDGSEVCVDVSRVVVVQLGGRS